MTDTVWALDFWKSDFWAAGFWSNAGAPDPPDPPAPIPVDTSGGWTFFLRYEQERDQRRRRKREQDEAEEATQALPEVDREIAKLLHAQEAKDAEREELGRLQALADRYAGQAMREGVSRRASAAILKAQEERTRNALEQMRREIERMLEEEEIAVLQLLLNDD